MKNTTSRKIPLVSLREARGLSQKELAKDLHVSVSSIALYETGRRTPRLAKATEIAEYFNVPLESIKFGSRTGM